MGSNINHKNVAIYARVSTEHESQVSALFNQIEWYDDVLKRHPEWNLYLRYVDEGITGTQAKKRPQFLNMVNDAKQGKFDLIITREVSRFARNTVDTLQATRELKKYDVEVFFIEDNIWTMDGDGELRLTIMASLSQDESRKISTRVKAGQASSRRQGVLYGNGNILGYNRVDDTYQINEDQAESVRTIFNLYSQGIGIRKLVTELEVRNLKNSIGTTKWYMSTIQRILDNTTYFGTMTYGKTYSTDYLEQIRKTNFDDSKKILKEIDIPKIVDKELWDKCYEIRKSKTISCNNEEKRNNSYGYKKANCVWLNKLKCKCGSSMRRNKWRVNKDGTDVYGYQCYNQAHNGNVEYRQNKGLDTSNSCNIKMVAEWKLKLMAEFIFNNLWNDKAEIIKDTYAMINENVNSIDINKQQKEIEKLEKEINKNQSRIANLIELRVDGEITKEEFNLQKDKFTKLIEVNTDTISNLDMKSNHNKMIEVLQDVERILFATMNKEEIDDEVIDKSIDKIIIKENNVFDWYLSISDEPITLEVNGNKNGQSPIYVTDSTGSVGTKIGYLPFLTFVIKPSEIKAFKNSYGSHTKISLCSPMTVNVYIK